MISIDIPGFGVLNLAHLVCDYNGTLARDGLLLNDVSERLFRLANHINIHIITADTFGKVATQMSGLPCTIHILSQGNEAQQKQDYVNKLGAKTVIAFGNGNNDVQMLESAAVGMVVIGDEGTAGAAVSAADIVVSSALNGLSLLLNPLRLKATLRF